MGQKIHPLGFRLGYIVGWDSQWYFNDRDYAKAVALDKQVRDYLHKKLGKGHLSNIKIERAASKFKVTLLSSRPGIIIGRGGKGIDEISFDLNKLVRKVDNNATVQINVVEVRQPELNAQLVADNIAIQLEKRVSHRRCMRQAMNKCVRMNGRGIKVMISGRLGGHDIARSEVDKVGKVPLHTLRADIDYATSTAFTIYGSVGVKVWVYKGEVLPERNRSLMEVNESGRRNDRRSSRPRRDTRKEGVTSNVNA